MIKAFLFDYGGVMTASEQGNSLFASLGEAFGISLDQAQTTLAPLWRDFLKGTFEEDDFWEAAEEKLGRQAPPEKRHIWNAWDKQARSLPEMQELVATLRNAGYTVGLLSNAIPNTEQEIRENGGYAPFDFLVISCKVGTAKPEIAIYQQALAHLPGILPSEIVFIDDQERCLTPAREMGMHTILATSSSQIITDVHKLTM
jgi:putative hydrolase of the HAD superfamily